MLKTEAIEKFLVTQTFPMCKHYTYEMEVQVNVAKDDGEPITGTFSGHRWYGFSDGLQTWKHFRIPFAANSNPTYIDKPIGFDISVHAEAIGMTGWNWVKKKSLWVGFDFDSIIGHKEGLTQNELSGIIDKISNIPFVSIYSSTGGNGYHIYVFTSIDSVNNHTEHAAISKAILSKISALTGINLETKVDSYGGILWVWHRKATPDKSFKLIKQHSEIINQNDILNWKEYLDKVSKSKLVHGKQTNVDELVASNRRLTLSEEQIKLLKWFETSNSLWWWNDDRQMLVCHTSDLKRAYTELKLKGIFNTISTGKEQGNDQNCFCFPLTNNGWIVRRHTKEITEHLSWFRDSSGWTTTYFNCSPTLRIATKISGGIEGEKDYSYKSLVKAIETLNIMGIECEVPNVPQIENRSATIKDLKNGKVVLTFVRLEHEILENYIEQKGNWVRIFFLPHNTTEVELHDNLIRHIVSLDSDFGWYIQTNSGWINENRRHIELYLGTLNKGKKEVESLLGNCIVNNWVLVNKPFQPEYPGNREWNMKAAQFRYNAKAGQHRTWDKILSHCGKSLDDILIENSWCTENGIYNGLLYLQCWLACCLQYPLQPTPYLFFFSPEQNTGKSIFHEALNLLFNKGTVVRADQALTNSSGFNGELFGAVFCIIEETNLSKKNTASDKIKDWVTSKSLTIRQMYKQPHEIPNSTHWIQCANDSSYCPIFTNDTRIMLIKVTPLENEIPKEELLKECEKEAAAFLHTLMNFDIPESTTRLRPPIIMTEEKKKEIERNESDLQTFINEKIIEISGHKIQIGDFYQKFIEWLEPLERQAWSLRMVAKRAPFIKGKYGQENQTYFGNVDWVENKSKIIAEIPYKIINGRLTK